MGHVTYIGSSRTYDLDRGPLWVLGDGEKGYFFRR